MRSMKTTLVIEALVLVAAIAYLASTLLGGIREVRTQLIVFLVVVIVVMVGQFSATLMRLTLVRESLVRRFFVSPDWIYNHEIGYAPLERIAPDGDAFGFVTFAAEALANMSYGFEVASPPSEFDPGFVIDSRVFLFHSASNDPEDGVVVDEWRGILRRIRIDADGETRYEDISRFDDAGELARLLDDNDALGFCLAQGDIAR